MQRLLRPVCNVSNVFRNSKQRFHIHIFPQIGSMRREHIHMYVNISERCHMHHRATAI